MADVPERALVVMAHPDDADFACAGTVALWTGAGTEVVYLMVTDGEAGGDEITLDSSEIAAMRREEQRRAAAEVGVKDVRFLGYPDGRVVASLGLRRDVSRVIRQVRPQRVVIPSPERDWDSIAASHPDHMATGEAALNAVYPDARNPHAHRELLAEEGLAPWTVPEVWVAGGPKANHHSDITGVFDRKMAALASHESQIGDITELEPMLRQWMAANAAEAGLPEGALAEVFQIVHTA
ncbi:GlcNAc-PI de-N-acetylase [Nocardiopsis terrae]|uniref:LmbE family N-acetylglucosaminyl deacetylase n=1 Tax=Nocardiopsis terrae TaxID=372655 RepID=A0ABR9HDS3_9ACTN|nr:PIG-L deacetylase family protein [Nocardiopsis terrae]MBE1457179.1 LmbE family N-acetylglucosaminyl deacetylase [Nocardiopsis terrae]GHC91023.1 GlcNAc-PI de-N-acetylase [Nocardiopsis terrae]